MTSTQFDQENNRRVYLRGREAALWSGLLGLLLGLPWLSLSWLGHKLWAMTMAPYALFELLTRAMPGGVVTSGLDLMIRFLTEVGVASTSQAGKAVEAIIALQLALAITGGLAALYGWSRQRQPATSAVPLGLSLGTLGLLLAWWDGWGDAGVLAAALWPLALGLAWGFGLDILCRRLLQPPRQRQIGRRGFLGLVGAGASAVSLISMGVAHWLPDAGASSATAEPFPPRPTPVPPPATPNFTVVDGTRAELTPIHDFFRVDINLRSPSAAKVSEAARQRARELAEEFQIAAPESQYLLAIRGLVETPQIVTLEQIRQLPQVDQFATLECISNPVAGDLIDTTLFSGARLRDVLGLAGVHEEAVDIVFRCADGYSESLPLSAAADERTLLCYAMGGEPLTEEHGFPFRLYTPDRFGMKNPKWITVIEAAALDYRGYWQERGWVEEAWVKTEAVIDGMVTAAPGQVELGGVAFAGDRGIVAVEIRVDQGPWQSTVINRPISPLTWVQWAARLELSSGEHQFEVRAIDGDGKVQTNAVADPFPSGASGYHRRTFRVAG